MVRVHAVLGHQQPVHRGPLKTPVPSRAGDGPPVFDRRALVEVGKQRQRHSGRVFEPALPLLLGPHEEQVLRHFTGERAEPGARGREDGGLGPGVARLRAPGALAALAAEFPAYFFFFFFFFFCESKNEEKKEEKNQEKSRKTLFSAFFSHRGTGTTAPPSRASRPTSPRGGAGTRRPPRAKKGRRRRRGTPQGPRRPRPRPRRCRRATRQGSAGAA